MTLIAESILDDVLELALADADTLSLHAGDPGADGSANELTEDGYAREAIAWASAASGEKASDGVIDFTAAEDWPEVTHVALWLDDTETPVFIASVELAAARTVVSGSILRFASGAIKLTASGG
jgi:hypothetical protein